MAVTLTGNFTATGLYSIQNNGGYGQGTAYAGVDTSMSYKTYCAPGSGDAFDEGYQDTLSDTKAVLKITATQERFLVEDALEITIYSTSPVDTEPMYFWQNLEDTRYIVSTHTIEEEIGTQTVVELTLTNTTDISNLLAYGCSINAGVVGSSRNKYRIYDVSIELTGESSEAGPVLTLNTTSLAGTMSEGTYYHPAGDDEFTVSVGYSQELGTAMQYLRYTVKTAGDETGVSTSITGTSFTVDRSFWTELPASGTLEIMAVSAHGIPSETLVLPWVITHYDLSVTTPVSGAIIQTGEDVVLAWNLVLPEGMPSAPVPSRYTIWPAWDDSEEFQVAYGTTERTYTISSDSLAGHTKLKLLILDEYGTDGASVRGMDSGTLVMLYLQPSAALHGITVGIEHLEGKYTPLLTVLWESEGQTAFQITADDFDTGAVWGTTTQYTIPRLFADGVHVIRLRIQDANGTWGEWSDPVYVDAANQAVDGTVSLAAQKAATGVRLSITGTGDALQYADVLIYRDGVLIAQLPGTDTLKYEYTDAEVSGTCSYYVRLAIDHGFYAQSETVTIDATPGTDGILLPDGTWIALKYTRDFPRVYQSTLNEETYEQYYAGRQYPVFMRSGRKARQITREYIDKSGGICDALEAASGSVVLYKTTLGLVIRGELNSVTAGRGAFWSTVSFRLLQSDEPAELTYTPGVNSVAI